MSTIRAMGAANHTPVPGVNVPIHMDGVEKSRISIPVRDGSSIEALLYQPTNPPKEGSPLFVAYHGGGWCLGVPEFEEVNWCVVSRVFLTPCAPSHQPQPRVTRHAGR